jgi:hypothetical protein
METDLNKAQSLWVDFVLILITIVTTVKVAIAFNLSYSLIWLAGAGAYIFLSVVYSLLAKSFSWPHQRIENPMDLLQVTMPWWF